ncbi:MAG: tetratricopeptide repeat protein, partial [Deltaproteobacteria bacterium]|nr:tetratricopeptide repeat protein [Deltaproteobacteria bacterium]
MTLKYATAFFVAIAVILSIAAFERNILWTNKMALWQDTMYKSLFKARPHTNVGMAYDEEGALDKAEEEYKKAIQLEPDYLAPYGPLAVIYGKKGDVDRAIRILSWMIPRLPEKDPKIHTALGVAYKIKGMLNEAEMEFQKALAINPHYET